MDSVRQKTIDLIRFAAPGKCKCGGHRRSRAGETLSPYDLLTADFAVPVHTCDCGRSGRVCPRYYLALSGFILGFFLVTHLTINALGFWPASFQAAVTWIHQLGISLPVFEGVLVLIPLAIHVYLGLRTLARDKLKFGIKKHHHGSNVRNWLQRASASILFTFLMFHVSTMSRWGLNWVYRLTNWQILNRYSAGGLFDPANAFASASAGLGRFWNGSAGSLENLLIAQFYLLGIAAAVYHAANGVSTGSEVLGLTASAHSRKKLWSACICAGLLLGGIGLLAWYSMALVL